MTALPWDVAPEPMREDVEVYTLVLDANHCVVADCGILGRSDDENEAHARMIVEAVNGRGSATEATEAETAGVCTLCGEPMPEGEEMFKYHGYSGPCPTESRDGAPDPRLPRPGREI